MRTLAVQGDLDVTKQQPVPEILQKRQCQREALVSSLALHHKLLSSTAKRIRQTCCLCYNVITRVGIVYDHTVKLHCSLYIVVFHNFSFIYIELFINVKQVTVFICFHKFNNRKQFSTEINTCITFVSVTMVNRTISYFIKSNNFDSVSSASNGETSNKN